MITSPRFNEIFGFYRDKKLTYELLIKQLIGKQDPVASGVIEASLNRDGRFDLDYSLKRFDNEKTRWVTLTGTLTYDKNDKPDYITGLIYDITEQKLDNIRKNDFIAMVSHELKTPLTSIHGYVQLLVNKAKKTEDTFTINALHKASTQIKKMTSLINGFLNLSSFESGKIQLNKAVFEIGDLIDEIVEEIKLTNICHTIEVYPCPVLTVYADRDKIGQVINNLLSNAIKYTPGNKAIEIHCNEINGMMQLSVEDEGLGIKPQDQEQLFNRYFRIENDQMLNTSGFGLGLYLSAEIVKRHTGEIWVKSDWGKGSRFYFNLPLDHSHTKK
ncbi:signal transduction histidine kinase [Pedobacter sp. CG_S7]|uniref:PAS domain-containing sensor histidine kinase n=1 Tax=Pedobacter sp. CG_S7 TaxID=3143930 RepID=UPI0033930BA3